MKRVEYPDRRHVDAAAGWLDLGNHFEAKDALCRISDLTHGDALSVHARLHAREGRWDMVLDFAILLCDLLPANLVGWLFRVRALQELARSHEAYELLTRMKPQFGKISLFSYEYARTAVRLGKRDEAWQWLKAACETGDAQQLKTKAYNDPELRKLWNLHLAQPQPENSDKGPNIRDRWHRSNGRG